MSEYAPWVGTNMSANDVMQSMYGGYSPQQSQAEWNAVTGNLTQDPAMYAARGAAYGRATGGFQPQPSAFDVGAQAVPYQNAPFSARNNISNIMLNRGGSFAPISPQQPAPNFNDRFAPSAPGANFNDRFYDFGRNRNGAYFPMTEGQSAVSAVNRAADQFAPPIFGGAASFADRFSAAPEGTSPWNIPGGNNLGGG